MTNEFNLKQLYDELHHKDNGREHWGTLSQKFLKLGREDTSLNANERKVSIFFASMCRYKYIMGDHLFPPVKVDDTIDDASLYDERVRDLIKVYQQDPFCIETRKAMSVFD